MTKWIIGILLLYSGLSLSSQSKKIDSLRFILKNKEPDKTELLNIHYRLAGYLYNSNKDSSLVHIEKGLQLIEDKVTHPTINRIDFLYHKLNIKHRTGLFDEALCIIDEIDQTIEHAHNKPKTLINKFRALANIAYEEDDIGSTMSHLDTALLIAEESEDPNLQFHILTEYAIIYSKQGNKTDSVVFYLIEASKHIKDDIPNLIVNYINIGNLCYHLNIDSTSLHYLDKVLDLKEHSSRYIIPATAAYKAASIYMSRKEWDKAEDYINQAISLAAKLDDKSTFFLSMLSKGKITSEKTGALEGDGLIFEAYNFFKESKTPLASNHISTSSAYLALHYKESDTVKAHNFFKEAKSHSSFDLFTNRYYTDHIQLMEKTALAFDDYQYALMVKKEHQAYLEDKIKKEQNLKSLQYEKEYQLQLQAKTKEIEIENLKEKKKRFIVLSSAIALTCLLGLSLLFLFMNLTKERSNNDELTKRSSDLTVSNKKLEEKNKELERFAFITSHDLKTPLLSIIGFSQLLKEEIKQYNNPTLEKSASFIHRSGTQMNKLIESVLEYSKLVTIGERTDHIEKVNLKQIVDLVRVALKNFKPGIDHKIMYQGDDVIINADKSSMTSLFQNPVGNGLHYNDSPTPCVKVSVRRTKHAISISFIDNGIGIAKERQSEIFTMFTRLHNNKKYSGTGIGLAIVQKIVDDLGATISIKSNPGQGSMFRVEIPLHLEVIPTPSNPQLVQASILD